MVKRKWDVLGIGNAAIDELIYLDQFPLPDSKIQVREAQHQGGGLVATALVAASRQGVQTAFCSLMGSDELSTFTLTELHKEEVDCSPCVLSEKGRPYHAWILVDVANHTRTILYQPGNVEPPLEKITTSLISSCQVLFIDHHVPQAGLKAAKLARQLGIPVIADLENERLPRFNELLGYIDHLVIGLNFARQITGKHELEDIFQMLDYKNRTACVLTAGDQGCWYSYQGGEILHYPAFKVKVNDTTGCGDVFHGVYAAAIARRESVAQAVELATAAAGLKAMHPGGRLGIPYHDQVKHFLREHHGLGNLE